MLKNMGVHKRYNVEKLDYHEAFQLFHLNAFEKKSIATDHFIELSKRVIKYAKGKAIHWLLMFWVPIYVLGAN